MNEGYGEASVDFIESQMDLRRAITREDIQSDFCINHSHAIAVSVLEQERIYFSPRPKFRFDWEGGLNEEKDKDAVALQHKALQWHC